MYSTLYSISKKASEIWGVHCAVKSSTEMVASGEKEIQRFFKKGLSFNRVHRYRKPAASNKAE
jgi:hypothetical protein